MSLMDLLRKKQQCIEAIQVSAEARAILDSPMVKEFFAKAESSVLEKWKQTPDDAFDARERLFLVNKMLENFRQYFEGFIVNGKFAEKQLEEIIKQEELTVKKR